MITIRELVTVATPKIIPFLLAAHPEFRFDAYAIIRAVWLVRTRRTNEPGLEPRKVRTVNIAMQKRLCDKLSPSKTVNSLPRTTHTARSANPVSVKQPTYLSFEISNTQGGKELFRAC